jgi:tetratricopeptide (TPR) repeat protein
MITSGSGFPMSAWLMRLQSLLIAISVLSGCGGSQNLRTAAIVETLYALEQTPSRDPTLIADVDMLTLDQDAVQFIEKWTRHGRDPYEKVRALRSAVFNHDGLNFIIDDNLTLTAAAAFEQARGNCVALANFFVAAVRHLGMDASYQEIDKDTVRVEDAFLVTERHINVSGNIPWHGRQARYVLDYLTVPEEDFGQARIISDRRAYAHYYNNLAIQFLFRDDIETALQYLKKALLNDANVDFVWSNLGVVYARRGDTEASSFARQQAFDLQVVR